MGFPRAPSQALCLRCANIFIKDLDTGLEGMLSRKKLSKIKFRNNWGFVVGGGGFVLFFYFSLNQILSYLQGSACDQASECIFHF